MDLTAPQVRVLASLIEKEASVPDSYPLTLNALRTACNQSTNRRPVVTYDDRTIETALVSLKSMGLVRFMHPSHGGRTIRYRHAAGERWRLSPAELVALAALALRGPQTTAEVRSRIERLLLPDEDATVEELLDALAARSPEPLAARVERRPGERDQRWVAMLGGPAAGEHDWPDEEPDHGEEAAVAYPPEPGELAGLDRPGPSGVEPFDEPEPRDVSERAVPADQFEALSARVEELAAVIGAVAGRLARLERDLGLDREPGD